MTDYESDSYYFPSETTSQSRQSIHPNQALIDATASFNLRGVLKLLEAGIDPNEPLEDGITALHIAANADRDRVYVMQALLDYDADPNIQSVEGMTPLHVAATWGKLESIKLLLANNADPRVMDLSGKTPLDCSNELRHKDCVSYLREILQGRAIPRSVADVFDELDFESFHSQFLAESEPVLEDYLSDFMTAPRSREVGQGGRGKHRKNRGKKQCSDTPADLDTSDEQFLSELNQVLRSNLVSDREFKKSEHKTIESQHNTKTSVKNNPKKKSQPHKRVHSAPTVVTDPNKDIAPSRKHLEMSLLRDYPQQSSEEEIDIQNHTFTKNELSMPSRNNLNSTFEVYQEERSMVPLDRMNIRFSGDYRPESPSLANIDLADSDATLTLFNSDDSDFYNKSRFSTNNSSSRTKPVAESSLYPYEAPNRARVGDQITNRVSVVSNFVKADELIARNQRNRAALAYENQANTPEVVIQSEIQEFPYNRPVDKPIQTARMPDKLIDTTYYKAMLANNPTQIAEPTYDEEKNLHHKIDFATSQPFTYNENVSPHVTDNTEMSTPPLDEDVGDEFRRTPDYSQIESYIQQPPENRKKAITKKIGEIVSKGKISKPKLSLGKPNFLKSKETKQTTVNNQNNVSDLNFRISDITSFNDASSQQDRFSSNRVSPSSFHTSEVAVTSASKTSTGTQTFPSTPSPASIRSEKSQKRTNKSNIKTQVKPDVQAISAKLEREYLYNESNSLSDMYPQLSDSTEQIQSYEEPYKDTPPTYTYTPDNPSPYQGKTPQTQDFSHSPYTNTDTPINPNSFSNPYLDTTVSPHTPTYPQPTLSISTDTQLYAQTEQSMNTYSSTSTSQSHTNPTPPTTNVMSSQSPNAFINLLEEVNKSLPYELKLTDTPTTPKSPNTPTLPSSLKQTGQPTPFTQVGFSPENPSPVLSTAKSLTPRSKRRVTIYPYPTEVQFCDEYDRTPVMPSLNQHISDDSDETRDEIVHELTSHPGAQAGGTYVPPPPYPSTPPPMQPQASETLDATFDLDPCTWKDSPTYICLDEYLKLNTQEQTPRPPSSPSGAIPPQLALLSDKQLREELVKIGEQPGPITPITRPLYMRYLSKVCQDPALISSNCFQGYLYELAQVLMATKPIPDEQAIETEMCHFFDNPPQNCTWRGGITKESFNYILIDPRISQNLPSQIAELSELDRFRIFVESIFYIGKGKRSRPYSHLYEAINCEKSDAKPGVKHQRILDIWSSGLGVVSLHCFQGIIAVEAFTREACILEAIGLSKLTNSKRGEYYGAVSVWNASKKRRLGVYLLHRAMHILIAEGERQICKANLTK